MLRSRVAVPAHGDPTSTDWRRLGIAVASLTLDEREPGEDSYREGWHKAEAAWRWTDGNAVLSTGGARRIAFRIALTERYRVATAPAATRAVA
jgi:hypothetical protein